MPGGVSGARQRLRGYTPPATPPHELEDGQDSEFGERKHPSMGGEMGRFFKDITSAPDRGKSFYQQERQRQHLASLVEAGRHAGRTRVEYAGRNIKYHLLTKDFFITMINQKTTTIMLVVAAVYLFVFLFFSIWWYLIVRFSPGCLYGATTYIEAFTFAVVTHMTIGYGNTGPQACWAAAWLIAVQIIIALLLESIVIGIVFARISHPKQRSRSIFISDSAIISRRDGILKFMFRVADIRRTQVVDPKIKAFMYTWGEGRVTAEGEKIPVRCEPLDIGYIDGMLLLPLIIEHTIDERSPLCGHTHDSLMALNAEVVVTFEGTTEFGNPFMTRRSYLPTEIHWGHMFAEIICKPAGEDSQHYLINLNKFHDVLPQEGMPMLAPSQLSQLVVNRAKRTVPYPLLGENTLVLSDLLCLGPNDKGQPCLMCRTADTYPNQMLEITVRMYLYRWRQTTSADGQSTATFLQQGLECGYETGEDRLYLRLPVEVAHVIDDDSPIKNWLQPGGLAEDADAEIVVVINAYLHVTGQNRLRQRTYTVHNHVRYGYRFAPIVKHPAESRDRKPRVRWAHFHDVQPAEDMAGVMPGWDEIGLAPEPSHPGMAAVYARLPSIAPESHGAVRSVEMRQRMFNGQGSDQSLKATNPPPAHRASVPSGSQSVKLPPRASLGSGGRLGLVPEAAVASAPVMARPSYQPTAQEERNDYTVLPIDLSRYAATAGNEGDSLTLSPAPRRLPLPTAFAQQLAAANQHQQAVEGGTADAFVLFPEVQALHYALNTTDAGDSLPHAQALHPTLPGPDRFRVEDDNVEKNDYTLTPQDLSRYMAQMAASAKDGVFGQRADLARDAAAELLAEQRLREQQLHLAASAETAATASSQGGESGYGTAATASSQGGESGYGTAASTLPTPALSLNSSQPSAEPVAPLAPALPSGGLPPQQQQQQQQQQDSGSTGLAGGASGSTSGRPSGATELQEGQRDSQEQQQEEQSETAEEKEEQRQHAEDVAQQLQERLQPEMQQRLSRPPSTWALGGLGGEQQEGAEEEEEGAGPIHFLKQESWQKDRALKNLFEAPDSPPAPEGSPGGPGSSAPRQSQ